MGTNYYLHDRETDLELLHIGKSSAGWCFSLHVYPTGRLNSSIMKHCHHPYENTYPIDTPIYNLADWKKLFFDRKYIIRDEYGDDVLPKDMIETITKRGRSLSEYQLRRHTVDDRYCIGNAHGTYDFIVGDFS